MMLLRLWFVSSGFPHVRGRGSGGIMNMCADRKIYIYILYYLLYNYYIVIYHIMTEKLDVKCGSRVCCS